jgi:hypothetical protein
MSEGGIGSGVAAAVYRAKEPAADPYECGGAGRSAQSASGAEILRSAERRRASLDRTCRRGVPFLKALMLCRGTRTVALEVAGGTGGRPWRKWEGLGRQGSLKEIVKGNS